MKIHEITVERTGDMIRVTLTSPLSGEDMSAVLPITDWAELVAATAPFPDRDPYAKGLAHALLGIVP